MKPPPPPRRPRRPQGVTPKPSEPEAPRPVEPAEKPVVRRVSATKRAKELPTVKPELLAPATPEEGLNVAAPAEPEAPQKTPSENAPESEALASFEADTDALAELEETRKTGSERGLSAWPSRIKDSWHGWRQKRGAKNTALIGTSNELGLKIKERQRSQRRRIMWSLGGTLAGVLLLVLVVWLLYFSKVFGLQQVSAKLQPETKPEWSAQVVKIMETYRNQPVLSLDTDAMATEIDRLPFVANSKVTTQFPHTAIAEVEVRQPVALVPHEKQTLVVDKEGVILKYLEPKGLKLPVIQVEMGKESTGRSIRAGLKVLDGLPPEIRSEVRYLSVPSPTNVQLHLGNGALVKWGSPDDTDFKARVLKTLIQRHARVYDLTSPVAPVTSQQ
ncbi:cell division protein FtsQ/DivIB [Boudabousia liubingyangii]|uniref:cell division protein FtsQ/DivIB n=1 Tax=Boudabousia liubingyangii TaxID=1921764 RepID=UPI00093EE139|nr:cell division protein FtsQ/DivIB [Boudabousia liubingyangii]